MQPIAPSAASVSVKQPARLAEWQKIAVLVGGGLATGLVLEQLVPQRPAVQASFAALAAIVFTAMGLGFRRELGNTMAGFRFAGTVLAVIAAGAAVGTVVLQGRPPEAYRTSYGALAEAVVRLGLTDVAHSYWFTSQLGLLMAGLVVSLVHRWPVSWRNAGFFLAHLGLFSILAGAALSANLSVRGRIDLKVGGPPATAAALTQPGPGGETVAPLGMAVSLERFAVDKYQTNERLGLYQADARGRLLLRAAYELEPGVKRRLPGGGRFTLEGYYPNVDLSVAGATPRGLAEPGALQVIVDGREVWLTAGSNRVDTEDGEVAVLFALKDPPVAADEPRHEIALADGHTHTVRVAHTVPFAEGFEVRALRFFPDFTWDPETAAPVSASTSPDNPALEVELRAPGKEPARRWLLARPPAFPHPPDGFPEVVYRFRPAAPAKTVIQIIGAERAVLVNEAVEAKRQHLSDGLQLAGGRVRLGRLLADAVPTQRAEGAGPPAQNPIAVLTVAGVPGLDDGEVVLSGRARSALKLPGGQALVLEKPEEDVRSFQSNLLFARGGQTSRGSVAVNEPFTTDGWTFYQVNFDPNDHSYSGLEVVRDPGVPLVFLGFLLSGLGVLYATLVEPRRLRRREA